MNRSFFPNALTPVNRVMEVFSGLIMVLTITLVGGHNVAAGPEGVRALLLAALGCNVAWGIIDGVLYLMGQHFEHVRQARLVAAARVAQGEAAARRVLDEVMEPEVVDAMSPAEAAGVFATLREVAHRLPLPTSGLVRRDLVGALGCFTLCVVSGLPAVIPFLIFDRPLVALRVSNGILLASLFALGLAWAKLIGTRPLTTGVGLLLLGAAMVAVAVAFGG
jgi:VIT1/CCC1 family predicted Fe2+/Mn2+ transporter